VNQSDSLLRGTRNSDVKSEAPAEATVNRQALDAREVGANPRDQLVALTEMVSPYRRSRARRVGHDSISVGRNIGAGSSSPEDIVLVGGRNHSRRNLDRNRSSTNGAERHLDARLFRTFDPGFNRISHEKFGILDGVSASGAFRKIRHSCVDAAFTDFYNDGIRVRLPCCLKPTAEKLISLCSRLDVVQFALSQPPQLSGSK
jgi:hypothetical protein